MTWRTFDFICPMCDKQIFDELVDVNENGEHDCVFCPICDFIPMNRQIPVSNFQFSKTFFNGMGPRRVEAQYIREDGSTVTEDLTHKVRVE